MSDFESFEFTGGSLEDVVKHLKKMIRAQTPRAWRNDPKNYPRSVKIEDEALLMQLWRIEKLGHERIQLQEQIELVNAQATALKMEIFQGLRATYPTIDPHTYDADGSGGWRIHNNAFYYVGWDGDEPTPEE